MKLQKQKVLYEELGSMPYKQAWDYQELLLRRNTEAKAAAHQLIVAGANDAGDVDDDVSTTHHLLFVEHPPVYTLGKSGKLEHVLISEEERTLRSIEFYHTNRGGDITFHGPGQLVGYPIFDLEKFYTDIGRYLRNLEEVIIKTIADFGIHGERSSGETGVWLDPDVSGKARKICAIGVRCSRWITMHGFAFNVNTDLNYFNHIVPCGIQNKAVTSLEKELGYSVDMNEVKEIVKKKFEEVFDIELVTKGSTIL